MSLDDAETSLSTFDWRFKTDTGLRYIDALRAEVRAGMQ
jgi:hypothetical protein